MLNAADFTQRRVFRWTCRVSRVSNAVNDRAAPKKASSIKRIGKSAYDDRHKGRARTCSALIIAGQMICQQISEREVRLDLHDYF